MSTINRNDPCPCGSGKKYKKCCFMDNEKNNDLTRAMRLSKNPDEIKNILLETLKTYVLKVSLLQMGYNEIDKEVSCIIEICGKATLFDLHIKIQIAFDWDNDHMFSFYLGKDMDDRQNEYSSNPIGEHTVSEFREPTKPAGETELRDLNLQEGREFTYLFDYGDQLLHKIVVESVRESSNSKYESAKIISKTGKAPEQYG